MSDGTFHLFAYGTLRSAGGHGRASELLTGCTRVGTGMVTGTRYDLPAYPALLLGGEDPVEGDIWRCPARVLPRLDRYEGVEDGLFRRVGVRVGGIPCWVYVAGPALGPQLSPDARARRG